MTAQVTQYVLFFFYFTEQIHIRISLYCFLQLASLDESEEEERTRTATKEEEDVDVLQSWMEVGGLPACPEEEVKGLLAEVNVFLCFSHAAFPSPSPITDSSLTILALDCYWLFPPSF